MKKRFLALLIACCLLLTGCLEGQSLDRYGYVIAIAYDLGEQLDYKITFMLQKPAKGESEQSSGSFVLVTAECNNLFEAIQTLSSSLPFELNFARTSFMVFSHPLLYTRGDVLDTQLDLSFAKLRIRYNIQLFVSLTSAKDALNGLENEFYSSVTKLQSNFVSYADETGWIPITNTSLLDEAISDKTFDAILPLMGVSEDALTRAVGDSVGGRSYAYIGGRMLTDTKMKTGLAGAAILSGGEMVGILDGRHVQLVRMANGEFQNGRVQMMTDDGKPISVSLRQTKKPSRKLELGNPARGKVEVYLRADIELPQSDLGYTNEELEGMIEDELSAAYPPLFAACRELNADVFGFGRLAKGKFSLAADWENFDWKSAYRTMEAAFSVEVDLVQSTVKTTLE